MVQPENPPSFIVRIEAHKAASANGFRLERGVHGGWLSFGSTTAQVGIWIAGVSKKGPWLLSVDRSEVCTEFRLSPTADPSGPGIATFAFDTLQALYGALDRAYRLGVCLPDAPFNAFQSATRDLPRTTEVERLVVQRVGQDLFRQALLAYWNSRCPMTGITTPELLRASHIIPWAECETDQDRLNVHNGFILSALWDAAFDAGLVSFNDGGAPLASTRLSGTAATALGLQFNNKLSGLTDAHRANLAWHRSRYGFIV